MNEAGLTFGLFVTGKGESLFLPKLFQSLRNVGPFRFEVVRKIEQLRPRQSAARLPAALKLPTRDEEMGLQVRGYLQSASTQLAILVDDLEYSGRDQAAEIFQRYRQAIDSVTPDVAMRRRSAVHFLVMMLEAYYFAHSNAVNGALGANVLPADFAGDVETIRHPKGDLKQLFRGFDEVRHGDEIMGRLNIEHVLSNPRACASLRTLFAWCVEAILEFYPEFQGEFPDFQLENGIQYRVTNGQLNALRRDE